MNENWPTKPRQQLVDAIARHVSRKHGYDCQCDACSNCEPTWNATEYRAAVRAARHAQRTRMWVQWQCERAYAQGVIGGLLVACGVILFVALMRSWK